MNRVLIRLDGTCDRRAIMTEAHRQFSLTRCFGWSFGRCLSFAWKKANAQRERVLSTLTPEVRPRRTPPIVAAISFPFVAEGTQHLQV